MSKIKVACFFLGHGVYTLGLHFLVLVATGWLDVCLVDLRL